MNKENKIIVTVDWDFSYDEGFLTERVENAIVKQATEKYIVNLEKKFEKKLEKMLHDQAFKIVKNISTFELDQCNTNGLKETISMEDFIIKKSIESLQIKRDSYGRTDRNADRDQRTMLEWVINDTIKTKDNEFTKALTTEIVKIEYEYQEKIQDMVTKALAPVYKKLVDKLNF